MAEWLRRLRISLQVQTVIFGPHSALLIKAYLCSGSIVAVGHVTNTITFYSITVVPSSHLVLNVIKLLLVEIPKTVDPPLQKAPEWFHFFH